MKVTQKKIDDENLLLEATATVAEVDDAFKAAQFAFAQQMNLQPEKEKSIAQVAEEQLGIKDLDTVVQSQAMEYLTPFALDKKNITPAFPPQANPQTALKRGSEYKFTLEVALKPDYELTSYDPVQISVPAMSVSDAEVEAQLAQMAESYAEYVKDDPHVVKSGDSVLLALEATENGEPLSGLNTEGRTYTTNAGLMPEGFDKNIIGMDVGETKKFSFTGPSFDESGKEIEQTIECTATVKEIQKKVIPAVTDAWVKKNMPMFENLGKLKGAMREQLSNARAAEYENYKRQMATTELAKRFEGKIADPVYEAMQKNLMNNLQMQLQQQGMTFEQFLEQNGGEQQVSMMMMMQTRQSLVEGYALDALFRHEKMTLTDEDIIEACKQMNPQQPQLVKEQMEKAGCNFVLRETASHLKAAKWLVDHAEVTVQE